MSQHTISCTLIHRHQQTSNALEAALRKAGFKVELHYATSWSDLETGLVAFPALLFCPGDFMQQHENRLLEVLQQRSPDTLLVKTSLRQWEPLATRLLGVDVCAISTGDADFLQQQIDYLLNYASLKTRFRHCKHLLSIAELRCQWLVDYSREPVAFIGRGKHLHANVAYLSLFGLNSDAEMLTTPLAQLVLAEEWGAFNALNASAERSARPSNRLLVTLVRSDKRPFRAEIRFIPSVFRGQRCVQLHVHALLPPVERRADNPWELHAATPAGNKAAASKVAPAKAAQPPAAKMQIHFQETLNLRANTHATLLVAEPTLHYADGKRVTYRELLEADPGKRLQLDWWCIRNALRHPLLRRQQSAQHLVMVGVGHWIFKQGEQAKALVQVFHKNPRMARRLVLVVSVVDCLANMMVAGQVLHALKATGVKLVLDQVLNADLPLIKRVIGLGADMVRLHPDYVRDVARNGAVPQPLQEVIQAFDSAGVAVIVDGVRDITTLNLLCVIPATYLQGEILNKLSR